MPLMKAMVRNKMENSMDERDVAKRPVKDYENPRYGMGYEYYDWMCPNCRSYLAPEPAFERIPRRCQICGQLLEKMTREEAEKREGGYW